MTVLQMEEKLKEKYPDCDVVVVDLTGTQDHYEVRIASEAFNQMNRIQRHRAIMEVFDPELKTGEVHALTIKALPKN